VIIQVCFLALGWLLGVLNTSVVDSIRRRRMKVEVRVGVIAELRGLRFRLALTANAIARKLGIWNKEFLEWLTEVLRGYDGPWQLESDAILETSRKFLGLSDQQFETFMQTQPSSTQVAGLLKKYQLPFLDSKMDFVGTLAPDTQMAILDIQANLRILHELADDIRYYLTKTFDELSPANRRAVEENLKSTYGSAFQMSRQIVDLIGKLDFMASA
jgi:hypothetical protein